MNVTPVIFNNNDDSNNNSNKMANVEIIGSEVHLWLREAAFRFLSEQEPRHWMVSFSAPPITSSKQSDRKMTFLVGHLQTRMDGPWPNDGLFWLDHQTHTLVPPIDPACVIGAGGASSVFPLCPQHPL